MSTPLVSVYCITYNHEKYIRNALDGFVSQKTNFPYEVYIHDDASTDKTPHIIKEYADRYPDIIHPIYQKENQYSKHIPITKTYILPLLQGKYIACCEGDDYWCDENKLQYQVDWLEKHKEYSLCVHNTRLIDMQSGCERYFNNSTIDMDIPIEDIMRGGSACFHTSSFMYRQEYKNVPEGFTIKGVGDYPRSVYLAICGKVRYLHQTMSVYRYNVDGSYTKQMAVAPISVLEKKHDQVIQMLRYTNEYTNKVYTEYINDLIKSKDFHFLKEIGDITRVKEKYLDMYNELNIIEKLKIYIKHFCPHLYDTIRKIRNR